MLVPFGNASATLSIIFVYKCSLAVNQVFDAIDDAEHAPEEASHAVQNVVSVPLLQQKRLPPQMPLSHMS